MNSQEKDLIEAAGNLENVKAQADRLIVNNESTQGKATELIVTLKRMKKQIEDKRKELVKPMNLVVKTFNAKAKELTEPIARVEVGLRGKLIQYQDFLEEEQRKREAKQKEEEEERQAKIDALNKKADKAETFDEAVQAEEKIQEVQAAPLTPDIQVNKTVRGKYGTTSFRKQWTFDLTDIMKVPRTYLMLDEQIVRAGIKSGIREIPGLRIYEKTITSVR